MKEYSMKEWTQISIKRWKQINIIEVIAYTIVFQFCIYILGSIVLFLLCVIFQSFEYYHVFLRYFLYISLFLITVTAVLENLNGKRFPFLDNLINMPEYKTSRHQGWKKSPEEKTIEEITELVIKKTIQIYKCNELSLRSNEEYEQRYIIVNLDKEQCLHPYYFNDGDKLLEFGCSSERTLTALLILLIDAGYRCGGDLHSNNPIIGSWAGDRIVIAGYFGDEKKFLQKQDVVKYAKLHEGQLPNLYYYAREYFEDISEQVKTAMLDDRFIFDISEEALETMKKERS